MAFRVAYSYLRFSEPRQQWGDSERRQSKATEDYCMRHNLTLDESLRLLDRGKSGFHEDNLATVARFLDAVERGKVKRGSVLIVENLDRLTRTVMTKAMSLFLSIVTKGIEIATNSPEQSYTEEKVKRNPFLIMEVAMPLYRGHDESRTKSDRVLKEWRQRFSRIAQEKLTARCPAWLYLPKIGEKGDRSRFKTKPEAVKIVKEIFRRTIEGEGLNAIARRLNQAGIPPICGRTDTNGWHSSYIKIILRSRAVLGEFQSYTTCDENGRRCARREFGKPIPDYFPRTITETDFYAAQAAMKRRKKTLPMGNTVGMSPTYSLESCPMLATEGG